MGILKRLFGKPQLADPVASIEAEIPGLCPYETWIQTQRKALKERRQVVQKKTTVVIGHKKRLEPSISAGKTLVGKLQTDEETLVNVINTIEARSGTITSGPDSVPQDVIDLHGQTVMRLQGAQNASVSQASAVLKELLGNTRNALKSAEIEVSSMVSKDARLANAEKVLTTNDRIMGAIDQEYLKIATIAGVELPKLEE